MDASHTSGDSDNHHVYDPDALDYDYDDDELVIHVGSKDSSFGMSDDIVAKQDNDKKEELSDEETEVETDKGVAVQQKIEEGSGLTPGAPLPVSDDPSISNVAVRTNAVAPPSKNDSMLKLNEPGYWTGSEEDSKSNVQSPTANSISLSPVSSYSEFDFLSSSQNSNTSEKPVFSDISAISNIAIGKRRRSHASSDEDEDEEQERSSPSQPWKRTRSRSTCSDTP